MVQFGGSSQYWLFESQLELGHRWRNHCLAVISQMQIITINVVMEAGGVLRLFLAGAPKPSGVLQCQFYILNTFRTHNQQPVSALLSYNNNVLILQIESCFEVPVIVGSVVQQQLPLFFVCFGINKQDLAIDAPDQIFDSFDIQRESEFKVSESILFPKYDAQGPVFSLAVSTGNNTSIWRPTDWLSHGDCCLAYRLNETFLIFVAFCCTFEYIKHGIAN